MKKELSTLTNEKRFLEQKIKNNKRKFNTWHTVSVSFAIAVIIVFISPIITASLNIDALLAALGSLIISSCRTIYLSKTLKKNDNEVIELIKKIEIEQEKQELQKQSKEKTNINVKSNDIVFYEKSMNHNKVKTLGRRK